MRISKICTWLGILFSVSVQIPSTFRNLVDRIEQKVSPKGQLDPKIGHTIKDEACYQGGIGGQKNFMDSAIINKEFWSSTFFLCLLPINGGDDSDTEEDRQTFRFLALVHILFEQTESIPRLSYNQTNTLEKIKEAFHFVMRCFFNEEAHPHVSHSRIHPFDKFASSSYQNSIQNVTNIMIHELVDSVKNDQFLFPYMEKKYRKFKEKYDNNKCT